MKIHFVHLLLVLVLMAACTPIQATDRLALDATPLPTAQPTTTATGFPWALVAVFIAAGFIMTYIKKDDPNKITTNCCVPLIDEKKMAAEKKLITEEEADLKIHH